MMTKSRSQSIHTYLKTKNTAKPQKTLDETTKLVYNQLTSCSPDNILVYNPYKCLNYMHKTLLILRYNMMKQVGMSAVM